MDTIERIVTLAKKRGITQQALERAAGLSENRISKWKNDEGEPTIGQIRRIADVLRAPVAFLMGESDDQGAGMLSADEAAALGLYRKLLGRVASAADALALLADLHAALGVVPPGHRVSGVSLGLERMPDPTGGAGGVGSENTPMQHVRKRTMPGSA